MGKVHSSAPVIHDCQHSEVAKYVVAEPEGSTRSWVTSILPPAL